MNRNEVERLEEAIERMARGEPAGGEGGPLLETARQVSRLAGPVPPPPHKLAPGRQRLLAEAARLRAQNTGRRKEQRGMRGIMKLATALVALILVSGFVLGAGVAMADSLPGEPLYGVKLTVEELQGALTRNAGAQATLELKLAERRMGEVEAMLQQNRVVDEETAVRVQEQLQQALGAAVQEPNPDAAGSLQQLAVRVNQHQRTMQQLMGETPDEPVRQLVRQMERVQAEAHAGAGDPAGLRQRLRNGTPPEPSQDPGAGQNQPAEPPGPGPNASVEPGAGPGPGPNASVEPGAGPGPGPQPEMTPGAGPGPGPQPEMTPGAGPGPGPQPTVTPGEGVEPIPQPTVTPGAGPGPGPAPSVEPGSGPGPGPKPGNDPGGGGGQGVQPAGGSAAPASAPSGGATQKP